LWIQINLNKSVMGWILVFILALVCVFISMIGGIVSTIRSIIIGEQLTESQVQSIVAVVAVLAILAYEYF